MKKLNLLLALLVVVFATKANNITTSNINLGVQDFANNFTYVNFDVAWENSWRTSTNESNYDGAWIIVKFRKNNTSLWQHATLNYAAGGSAAACGHTQAGGSTIQTSADGKGVWMYRDADGIGAVSWAGNKLRWNYGVDGVLDNDSVEVRVFAAEMVYVPQGAYNLGSGSTTEANRFRNGATDSYLNITSEAAITIGTMATNLFGYGNANMASGTIPAAFPKGYNAFWVMKYEITQQAYTDFLNTIDLAAYTARNIGATSGTHPNLVATFPERAADAASGVDVLSWMDWAAMRPFTEMEFEKACRGANILPIANEYAWGNTTYTAISGIQNNGTTSESFTTGNANMYFAVLNRPMRVGAFATTTSTRESSGATYYGIMEMTGNMYERAIAAGYADGRAFTGLHGDGKLDPTNYSYNVANWPILASGSGLTWRGGAYNLNGVYTSGQISDRSSATAFNVSNGAAYGGRGARTAE